MIEENLFERILIEPANQLKANRLLILSGKATVEMVLNHFRRLQQIDRPIELDLIIGRTFETGIHIEQHNRFMELCASGLYGSRLKCSYITEGDPVKSNIYIWMRNQKPIVAFFGSAVYTNRGFDASRNVMIEIETEKAYDYFTYFRVQAASCLGNAAEKVLLPLPNFYHEMEQLYFN